MSFTSCAELLSYAQRTNQSLAAAILESDLQETQMTRNQSRLKMAQLLQVMRDTSHGYKPEERSQSGLSGGDAAKVSAAAHNGQLRGGDYLNAVIAEALKTSECNACMKRIVAAPTAGACGVLPAVFLPLFAEGSADEDAICDALYVAAGFGQIIASRATLSGAQGGCQAEIGSASAMAAAALAYLDGASPDACAHAAAMALSNLLGLVCDPVAGLVEVPCVKRNVIGAVNAVSCANMAVAGVTFQIPFDEVVDAMARVGNLMSVDLRETAIGGLAGTPTGKEIAQKLGM